MLQNKNIIFAVTSLRRGGKERQLTQLFAFIQAGNKCLITERLNFNDNYLTEYKINSESIILLGETNFFKLVKKYRELIKQKKPDIIFSWEVKPTVVFLILSFFYNFILVNCSIRHGIRLWKIGQLFRSFVAWLSPFVIANSRAGLHANNLKENEHNFVLYNGISYSFPSAKLDFTERAKALQNIFDNSITEQTTIFISVANLVPYKDYFTILTALASVKYDFRYLIIGDGPLRTKIENRINELSLASKVKLLGKVKNVEEYLILADYYIHSSRGEGLSNSILEAMFMGLPIISTNTGGTNELVFDNSFKLFEYKNAARLSEILQNVHKYFKDFDPLSDDYKNHLSKFTFESMTKNFENILSKILRNE